MSPELARARRVLAARAAESEAAIRRRWPDAPPWPPERSPAGPFTSGHPSQSLTEAHSADELAPRRRRQPHRFTERQLQIAAAALEARASR